MRVNYQKFPKILLTIALAIFSLTHFLFFIPKSFAGSQPQKQILQPASKMKSEGGDDLLASPAGKTVTPPEDDLLSEPVKKPDPVKKAGGEDLLSEPRKAPGGDDLLSGPDPKEKQKAGKKKEKSRGVAQEASQAHEKLFAESRYPSAATCGTCHPKHYREWSVSQHSYSQLSPVYLSISNFLNSTTSGSMGDFCLRCHSQVGANLNESPAVSNLDRHPTSREGITCVVCHRMNLPYNKASGRVGLREGDLLKPIYGPTGGKELQRVLKDPDKYRVVTQKGKAGRKIHTNIKKFEPISSSTFCGSCHDVTLFNGFRLEEAFSEYRTSPAAAKGVTCQDCHMGKTPGVPSGYERGPAAVIGKVPTRPRKLTNHMFPGPDYSVIHPGIFPHNADAQKLATIKEWLQFDHKAGWGTEKFEDNVPPGYKFPDRWKSVDDRIEAREVLKEQFKRLEWARGKRREILRNGFRLGEVVTTQADRGGIRLKVKVENLTDGHNVPTGFTGERVVWLQVTVRDGDGKVIFRSGDLDPNGDVRDQESLYVHNGELPLDKQLFNLQSRFVHTNVRGGERLQIIPIPFTVTALPIVRPSIQSLILTGEPLTERNHRKGIEPLGHRWANYSINSNALTGKGPYQANVRLMIAPIPVNLIGAVRSVGFDYGLSPREIADAVVAGHEILWEKNISIQVKK